MELGKNSGDANLQPILFVSLVGGQQIKSITSDQSTMVASDWTPQTSRVYATGATAKKRR